jgi:L-ascorbate metabolism protein UlaG (beta-lactamase superfamily)
MTGMAMLRIQAIGGPTTLVELGGLRLLADPTFDPPGDYPIGPRVLVKTMGPAVQPSGLDPIDVVLLSHDQHPDNLDRAGKELLKTVSRVLTTPLAASRLDVAGDAESQPQVIGLEPWASVALGRLGGAAHALGQGPDASGLGPDASGLGPGGTGLPPDAGRAAPGAESPGEVTVTAVPALHGPEGSEPVVGPVTGFMLEGPGLPTVYVSGDNASLRVVDEIAERFPSVDVAVLFAGAACTPLVDGKLTIGSADAVLVARRLGARYAVPAHFSGWGHFTEGAEQLRAAFAAAGPGAPELVLLEPGEVFELDGALKRS